MILICMKSVLSHSLPMKTPQFKQDQNKFKKLNKENCKKEKMGY